MPNFLTKFDGTARTPRPAQVEVLKWLSDNWDAEVIALNLPTAVGKSAIARAIQIVTGADVVPPTNQLMDQYTYTYPGINALKGQSNYTCNDTGLTCGDSKDLNKECTPDKKGKPGTGFCPSCPYRVVRDRTAEEPTFFNSHSLLFYNMSMPPKNGVLVVDEAHNLVSMFRDLSGKFFNSRKYLIPKSLADISIEGWLQEQEDRLKGKKRKTKALKEIVSLDREIQQIKFTRENYTDNPENYAIELKKRGHTSSLSIQPLTPPRRIANRVLQGQKLILMSATLLPSDVEAIVGHKNFKYLSIPSPIPAQNRAMQYLPAPFPMNSRAEPVKIAKQINSIVAKHKNDNTIIHLTYGMAEKVAPFLDFLFMQNRPENKDEIITRFKAEGGVFLASGCNEGIDLPGDECRVSIIPMLFRLNPTDPVVRKKLGLPGGQTWYNEQTLKALIQQAGRSTRSVDDYSITYVLDPGLPRLMSDSTLTIPDYFKEAIRWQK